MKPMIQLDTDRDYRDARPLLIHQSKEGGGSSAEDRIQSAEQGVDGRSRDVGRVCGDVDSPSAPQAKQVVRADARAARRVMEPGSSADLTPALTHVNLGTVDLADAKAILRAVAHDDDVPDSVVAHLSLMVLLAERAS